METSAKPGWVNLIVKCPAGCNSLSVGPSINLMWHRNSQRTVKHTQKPSYELSLYSWAGLFEFMPHVVTTRHDLLINHVFTIQSITIVPKYCSHCCGHCTCEEMASHKGSVQTSSKSKPEPFWPAVSARLAHAVSGPHAALTQRESVCWVYGWSNRFHYVSCRFGWVEALFCWVMGLTSLLKLS